MERIGSRILAAAGLIAFLLLVAAAAAHYTFPYGAAGRIISQRVDQSGLLEISFQGPRPGLPFNYSLGRVEAAVRMQGARYTFTPVDRVDLDLSLFGLFAGRLTGGFEARTDQGEVEGLMQYAPGGGSLRLVIDRLDLPDFALTGPEGRDGLSGRLTGSAAVLADQAAVPAGGEGEFVISDGRVWGIQVPQFPLTEMDFDRLTVRFRLEPDKVLLDVVEISGPDGGVNLTGRVTGLRRPRVSFSGSARLGPEDAPLASMNLQVSGSLDNPRVQIRNMKAPDLKKALGM